MPEWLHRALIGILVAIAVLFFWRCIAGVMGAPSMLIWIGGIGYVVVNDEHDWSSVRHS